MSSNNNRFSRLDAFFFFFLCHNKIILRNRLHVIVMVQCMCGIIAFLLSLFSKMVLYIILINRLTSIFPFHNAAVVVMVCGVVMLADGFYMMKNTEIVGDLKRGLSTYKVYFFVCCYCKKKKYITDLSDQLRFFV